MFVSYKWLQEYVDLTGITTHELAEKITRSGIEVEGVEAVAVRDEKIVVGYVMERDQHPNADKLSRCLVDTGDGEPKQIICGAPNVAQGQKVIVATPGARLPGGIKIKKAKLRGEESNGMICSLQELGIEGKLVAKEYSEGIFVFPSDAEIGRNAIDQLELDDEVLELGLTPNRADALNMIGVAYEVAAILDRDVKWPTIELAESNEKASDYITLKIEANEDNPLYVARVVKNVKVAPSPLWLQARLMKAGIRPINNVVDITNFVLLEYGQPLHAFDYEKLGTKEILVRCAKDGETITTLDDQERKLTSDHLVITNGTEPVALAGVMGGANSEVDSMTTTVLIESAVFTSATIRKAVKDFGLRSEASTRFEKGIDPTRTRAAADRAAQLMALYANGEVVGGVVEVDTLQVEEKRVSISVERMNNILGTALTADVMSDIFKRLQFNFSVDNDVFRVNVPLRRPDITIEEDLVEEIARLYGYDVIESTLPVGEGTPGRLSEYQSKRRQIRNFLEGVGLYQATTYSLTSKERAKQFALEVGEAIPLAMPMSEERSTLRLSLIPHLLDAVKYNQARQMDSLALYEVGKVFIGNDNDELPLEKERLASIITGSWHDHEWQGEKKSVDFFVAKGIVEGLLEKLNILNSVRFEAATREGMHPGRTANILIGDELVGYIGQLHPDVQSSYDLTDTYVFELSLDAVLHTDVSDISYEPISRYPSITRDIALVVDEAVSAGNLRDVIINAGGSLLTKVSLFDLYQGEHMEVGKKSVAFSLVYLNRERTLTDEEVTKAHDKVLQALETELGATLRK
ncbi:phenylalanine--tRNA ligase subunit beta [Bacillus sp. HMF5848]|uniref:phenylalanine--tRNA ligase subunit beta n=1 Tax=Bacillus sp. HMF5848 TaxID=2495421 RepID=UPI000F7B0B79|nr:phenylalanine--tRNA ligase subunit beta [Bacillus sp. HMF5848]RSK28096.1 phenylalanine--tRNA ligase subunit beta [Bacillus sp. HMF5848]